MKFNILSLFPSFFTNTLSEGVVGSAFKSEKLHANIINPRDFTTDVHKTVDDRPYGGGDGMVLLNEPFEKALMSIEAKERGPVVYLSPQGQPWNNMKAKSWGEKHKNITLICGRYAGLDQRFINGFVDEEISIGDYVISGGELAALVLIDSVARYIPGVLGNDQSAQSESFENQLLEGPSFTRPQCYKEQSVPEVLLSGNHEKVKEFRLHLQLVTTYLRRKDLASNISQNDLKIAVKHLLTLDKNELQSCGIDIGQLKRLRDQNA